MALTVVAPSSVVFRMNWFAAGADETKYVVSGANPVANVPDENKRTCVLAGYVNELVRSVIVDEPLAKVMTSCLPIENLIQHPLT